MEFVKSNKGKLKLFREGYIYVKQKDLSNGVVSYECERRRSKSSCKAKVKVRQGEIIEELHSHTHAPDTPKCEAAKVFQEMKERATETEETTQQIIAEACASISEEVATKIPSIHILRRDVRRYKQKKRSHLPLPSSAQDLVLPENCVKTASGETFFVA